MGPAPESAINDVAKLIDKAKNPVILLGLMASQPANSAALRKLLEKSRIPVTSTYQAAGAVNQSTSPALPAASVCSITRRATGCCIWRI